MSHSIGEKSSTGADPPVPKRPRLGNAEDLETVASIVKTVVESFNVSANPDGNCELLHYVDAMIGQRHRRDADSPPHVMIWLDLKEEELNAVEIGLALAARC